MLMDRTKYLLISILLLLTACSTMKTTPQKPDPTDPLQSLNRKIHWFNCGLDQILLRPIAQIYQFVIPPLMRKSVSNFFSNINEIPTVANDILQAKFSQALNDGWRFGVNSTVGIGGLFDVASDLGLPKHIQDFGLTLAQWGWKDSSYVELPILGPSTIRDALGIPVNYYAFSVYPRIKAKPRYMLLGLELISIRSNLLGADNIMNAAALDPYMFMRDVYLQKRNNAIRYNSKANTSDDGHDESLEEMLSDAS